MRLSSAFSTAFFFSALVFSVTAQTLSPESTPEHDLLIIANFPESNPFGHVVNGEKNTINFSVENQSGKNATLKGVIGAIHHAETGKLIKNLTTSSFAVPLLDSTKIQVPYVFFSEFKPGNAQLNIWVDYALDGEDRRLSAYNSLVAIVEPELSLFDLKLLSTYLMVAAIIGGVGYFTYLSYVPQARKKRSKKLVAAAAVAPSESVSASGYQDEWIPEHHLKKTKKVSKATSADELSGGELSGTEGKRRKGRK